VLRREYPRFERPLYGSRSGCCFGCGSRSDCRCDSCSGRCCGRCSLNRCGSRRRDCCRGCCDSRRPDCSTDCGRHFDSSRSRCGRGPVPWLSPVSARCFGRGRLRRGSRGVALDHLRPSVSDPGSDWRSRGRRGRGSATAVALLLSGSSHGKRGKGDGQCGDRNGDGIEFHG
jgi:hypothetical protein